MHVLWLLEAACSLHYFNTRPREMYRASRNYKQSAHIGASYSASVDLREAFSCLSCIMCFFSSVTVSCIARSLRFKICDTRHVRG